ncbi:hypothetical protein SNE40_000611 [Patella caerulea]|uniref:EGF-like domain-containing protein n=1 Tax=Patella caerulea TaxID=87958 RepID=A0AAN8KK77_PATCE
MSVLLILLLLLNITSIAPTSLRNGDEEEQNIIAEIDISLSLPSSLCDNIECKHGGTCLQGSCLCPAKTTGKFCEVSPCDGVECANGGQCVGDGVCNCTVGFGGSTCNMRVCNITECSGREKQSVCAKESCTVDGENCDTIDGIINTCNRQGEQCGEGFCINDNKCLNNTCRKVNVCDDIDDGTFCTVFSGGTCLDGFCRETCNDDSDCAPCIGGICAGPRCGESFCVLA